MEVSTTPVWAADGIEHEHERPALPRSVDTLIVGAGYTGLSAARETAAGGDRTWVLDAGEAGTGCSGRNGGQVAYSIKPTYARLAAMHGEERARGICHEGREAVRYLRALAQHDGLNLGWQENGCFFGAHTRRQFDLMVREASSQPEGCEQRVTVVPRTEQRTEIASDFYHGGCVYHEDASVDPLRMLHALKRRAEEAGAVVRERCNVLGVTSSGAGHEVATSDGVVHARKVLIATNGYTGAAFPWLRRRVIPIGSYQIATEPLGIDAMRELIPHGRNIVDSRRVVVYYRPSPDGQRLVFGGRAALSETDPLACVARLRQMMTTIFPQLHAVRIAHAWLGWVAYTFDTLPHLGRHEGMYYCLGYCGQGVPLAPYLGHRIGQQMMNLPEGRTAFDGLPFASRPYYFGRPWFLTPSVLAYRVLDRLGW